MKKVFLAVALAASLSACASTPDPAEVCTSEWVGKRSMKAVDNIFEDTESTVKSLRKVGMAYMEGKSPNIFQLFSLATKVKRLEKEVLRGSGIKDLKTVARTCNDTKILTDGISSYVDRLELPEQMRTFMESLPEYRNMVEKHIQDIR